MVPVLFCSIIVVMRQLRIFWNNLIRHILCCSSAGHIFISKLYHQCCLHRCRKYHTVRLDDARTQAIRQWIIISCDVFPKYPTIFFGAKAADGYD